MTENQVFVNKKLIDYCINPYDLKRLKELSNDECRQILPFLTRIWARSLSTLNEPQFSNYKFVILQTIRLFEDTNRIRSYLDADFSQIYEDVIRHLSIRKKTQTVSSYTCGEFETGSPTAKLLMISNILLNGNIRIEENLVGCKYSSIDYSLFDFEIYFQELSDLLCIIHAELGEVISLSQFVYTLLHSQSSSCVNFMLKLLANSVDSIFQIVDIILEGCNCSQIEIQRHKCLLAITSCWPSMSSYIITECIRRHSLPSVILFLAKEEDLISILLSMFQFEGDRSWFVQFLRSQTKNPLEKQAVDLIREELVQSCYKCSAISQLDLQLFKLYSGLRIFAGLKFNESEVKALIELILNTKEISVAVCFLLIYPPLYELDISFQRIVNWLKDNFYRAQQSILLIAIYCNSHQLNLLNDYVSNLVGFKLQLKSVSISSMSRIFHSVFPDDILVNEYMRSLSITPNLNARKLSNKPSNNSSSSSLGIYFLNQWIKSNTFLNKRQLDLSMWLFNQIKECTAPLHPVMISLIDTYILQLFNTNVATECRLQPLSNKLILEFFCEHYSDYDRHFTAKLLLFYYLLAYETKRREALLLVSNNIQSAVNHSTYTKSHLANLETIFAYCYSPEIFEHIPINYVLVKAKHTDYLIMYPSLLRMVLNLFGQFCQVEHCLFETKVITKRQGLDVVLDEMSTLKKLAAVDESTRNQAQTFKQRWLNAYSIHGRKLSLKTVSILYDLPKIKYEDIYSNPLVLLKCEDFEIYKCGPLFEVVLYILKECLLANKNQMENLIIDSHLLVISEVKTNQFIIKSIKERQELKNSLVSIQETGVIQILLDFIPLIEARANELVSREIKCLICGFIHQMFIENTNLAELVHFQGYSKKMMPILVRGVPSMHICLDFVPKLLSHSDIDKQIFAINLIAELCQEYPIVKTYNGVKLAINVANTLLQTLTYEERRDFFRKILNALIIFYTKLPPLTQECMSLIIHAVQTRSVEVDNLPPLVVA